MKTLPQSLPPSWEVVRLSEVTEAVGKVQPRQQPEVPFRYIDISGIDNQQNRVAATKRYLGKEAPSRARQPVQSGDILFSTVRTYLRNVAPVGSALHGCIASTGFCVIRPLSGALDQKFGFYLTLSDDFINPLSKIQRGTSYPAVRNGDVLARQIPLPPLNEQRRIVAKIEELFTKLDAGVEALKSVQALLKRYRQSVLKAAVEGKLTEDWRKEHAGRIEPASELLKRILAERRCRWEADYLAKMKAKGKVPKDDRWKAKYKEPALIGPNGSPSYLPRVPPTWTLATIDQVAAEVRYGTSNKTSADDSGVPVLRMGNIENGSLSLDSLKHLPNDHHEFPDLLLSSGDLLFNRTNSFELVGKTAVYEGHPDPCSFASYLIRVRLLEAVNPNFICFFINSMYGRRWIAQVVSQQVGQANVNGTKLKNCVFPLPPISEQEQIVQTVSSFLSIAEAAQCELSVEESRVERLRQAILKKAFEGQIVPQDAKDEPASFLLERISQEKRKNRKSQPRRLPLDVH